MDREQREKQRSEAASNFDAALRQRLAANSLTPRLRSYLEPREHASSKESEASTEGEDES